MQCIEHERGVRCLNPTSLGDSLCPAHRSQAGEARARASAATWKAIAQANTAAGGPTAEATDPWLGATKTDIFDHTVPQTSASWACEAPECTRCENGRCHWVLERTGQLCGFHARNDRPFCINHDPQARDEHRAQSSRGGKAHRTTAPIIESQGLEISLDDRAGIQAILHAVVTAELLGQINPRRSLNIVRALSVATRNFDNNPNRTRAQLPDTYNIRGEYLLNLLNNVLEEAAINDTPPEPKNPASKPPADDTKTALKLLSRLTK